MSDDDFMDVIDANLNGGFRVAKRVSKGMMKGRWGRMIFISSIVGLGGQAGQANYAASKAGLIGMAKSLPRSSPAAASPPTSSARADRNRHACGTHRCAAHAMLSVVPVGRLGQATRLPPPSSSWRPTRPPTSPVRCCRLMAGTRWAD